MNARKIALIQQSFQKIAALGPEAGEMFYAELFAIDPSLRSMFTGDLQIQQKKWLSAITYVVCGLHAPEKMINSIENLARVHLDYGVKPEHYISFGNALLRTLKKALGSEFTPEVSDAWAEAYRKLARTMREAAYGGASAKLLGAA